LSVKFGVIASSTAINQVNAMIARVDRFEGKASVLDRGQDLGNAKDLSSEPAEARKHYL
jgi:hypothetical protein